MLRTIGLTERLTAIVVFGVMTAVWCAAGGWLGSHRAVTAIVDQYGHWIVPGVFSSPVPWLSPSPE